MSQGKAVQERAWGSAFAPCPQASQAACRREQLPALFRLQHTHLSCVCCREAAGFTLH